MSTPFKMTGMSFGNSPMKQDKKKVEKKKEKTYSELTEQELADVVKRNKDKERTYEIPTDSISGVRNELYKRYNKKK